MTEFRPLSVWETTTMNLHLMVLILLVGSGRGSLATNTGRYINSEMEFVHNNLGDIAKLPEQWSYNRGWDIINLVSCMHMNYSKAGTHKSRQPKHAKHIATLDSHSPISPGPWMFWLRLWVQPWQCRSLHYHHRWSWAGETVGLLQRF